MVAIDIINGRVVYYIPPPPPPPPPPPEPKKQAVAHKALVDYGNAVERHQQAWVAKHGSQYSTQKSLQKAWEAAWLTDGAAERAKLGPHLTEYSDSVKKELEFAASQAGPTPAEKKAAIDAKLAEIKKRPNTDGSTSGKWADGVLDETADGLAADLNTRANEIWNRSEALKDNEIAKGGLETLKPGQVLSTEQVARLTPAQRAAYELYLDKTIAAEDWRAKNPHVTAPGNLAETGAQNAHNALIATQFRAAPSCTVTPGVPERSPAFGTAAYAFETNAAYQGLLEKDLAALKATPGATPEAIKALEGKIDRQRAETIDSGLLATQEIKDKLPGKKTEIDNADQRILSLSHGVMRGGDKNQNVRISTNHELDKEEAPKQKELAQAEYNALAADYNKYIATINKLVADTDVADAQVMLAGTSKGTPEHTRANDVLVGAQGRQTEAGRNLDLATLDANAAGANEVVARLEVEGMTIRRQALADQERRAPHLFDASFTNMKNEYRETGVIKVVVKDGQLYQHNMDGNDVSGKYQLTFDPGSSDRAGKNPINLAWTKNNTELIRAKEIRDRALLAAGTEQRQTLDTQIVDLTKLRNAAVAKHGEGITPETPVFAPVNTGQGPLKGPLAPGETPVNGPAAGQPRPDGVPADWVPANGRWMHPEVAKLTLDLAQLTLQRQEVDDSLEYLRYRLSHQELVSEGLEGETRLDAQFLTETTAGKNRIQTSFDVLLGNQAFRKEHDFTALSEAEQKGLIGKALNSTDAGVINQVHGWIKETGGENPNVIFAPALYISPSSGSTPLALIEVTNTKTGEDYVIDPSQAGKGDDVRWKYDSMKGLQEDNQQFEENGKIFLAKDLVLKDVNGDNRADNIDLEGIKAAITTDGEKWRARLDIGVGILTGLATIASFTPLAPVAAPLAFSGGTYLGARAGERLYDRHQHGQSLTSFDAGMEWAGVVTSALPLGSSGLRTIGLLRNGMTPTAALRVSTGAINATERNLMGLKIGPTPYAMDALALQRGTGLHRTALGLDVTAMGIGAPMIAVSGHDLAANWDKMSGMDRLNAAVGFVSGVYGSGRGAHGLWQERIAFGPKSQPNTHRTSSPTTATTAFSNGGWHPVAPVVRTTLPGNHTSVPMKGTAPPVTQPKPTTTSAGAPKLAAAPAPAIPSRPAAPTIPVTDTATQSRLSVSPTHGGDAETQAAALRIERQRQAGAVENRTRTAAGRQAGDTAVAATVKLPLDRITPRAIQDVYSALAPGGKITLLTEPHAVMGGDERIRVIRVLENAGFGEIVAIAPTEGQSGWGFRATKPVTDPVRITNSDIPTRRLVVSSDGTVSIHQIDNVLRQVLFDFRQSFSRVLRKSSTTGVTILNLPGIQEAVFTHRRISPNATHQIPDGYTVARLDGDGKLTAFTKHTEGGETNRVFEGDFDLVAASTLDKNANLINRKLDTESLVFNLVDKMLGGDRTAEGTIYWLTEMEVCQSCAGIINQFKNKYPNVEVVIFDNQNKILSPQNYSGLSEQAPVTAPPPKPTRSVPRSGQRVDPIAAVGQQGRTMREVEWAFATLQREMGTYLATDIDPHALAVQILSDGHFQSQAGRHFDDPADVLGYSEHDAGFNRTNLVLNGDEARYPTALTAAHEAVHHLSHPEFSRLARGIEQSLGSRSLEEGATQLLTWETFIFPAEKVVGRGSYAEWAANAQEQGRVLPYHHETVLAERIFTRMREEFGLDAAERAFFRGDQDALEAFRRIANEEIGSDPSVLGVSHAPGRTASAAAIGPNKPPATPPAVVQPLTSPISVKGLRAEVLRTERRANQLATKALQLDLTDPARASVVRQEVQNLRQKAKFLREQANVLDKAGPKAEAVVDQASGKLRIRISDWRVARQARGQVREQLTENAGQLAGDIAAEATTRALSQLAAQWKATGKWLPVADHFAAETVRQVAQEKWTAALLKSGQTFDARTRFAVESAAVQAVSKILSGRDAKRVFGNVMELKYLPSNELTSKLPVDASAVARKVTGKTFNAALKAALNQPDVKLQVRTAAHDARVDHLRTASLIAAQQKALAAPQGQIETAAYLGAMNEVGLSPTKAEARKSAVTAAQETLGNHALTHSAILSQQAGLRTQANTRWNRTVTRQATAAIGAEFKSKGAVGTLSREIADNRTLIKTVIDRMRQDPSLDLARVIAEEVHSKADTIVAGRTGLTGEQQAVAEGVARQALFESLKGRLFDGLNPYEVKVAIGEVRQQAGIEARKLNRYLAKTAGRAMLNDPRVLQRVRLTAQEALTASGALPVEPSRKMIRLVGKDAAEGALRPTMYETALEHTFVPNPSGKRGPKLLERGADRLLQSFMREVRFTESSYSEYWNAMPPAERAGWPVPGKFRVDDMTLMVAEVPQGLEAFIADIHAHSMGYDRRSGVHFQNLLDRSGQHSRVLFGSIPQFCGGDGHYSGAGPSKGNLKKAQALDIRVLQDLKKAYADPTNRDKAAKADLSLTGLDFSKNGKHNKKMPDPVDYGIRMMLENPGLFVSIGEVTGIKELVARQMGDWAWTIPESSKFQRYMVMVSAETGQNVVLHYDWGEHAESAAGRAAAAKQQYEHFRGMVDFFSGKNLLPEVRTELVKKLGLEGKSKAEQDAGIKAHLQKINVVFAHTGIGRMARPGDAMSTRTFKIENWDFQNNTGTGTFKTFKVTAPEHVQKIYELFQEVPNARVDISWNDVTQAFNDLRQSNPQAADSIAQLFIDHQDRILFGSDTVKPVNTGHYNQALTTGSPLFTTIARLNPEAAWKILRGNYNTLMDNAYTRVGTWTRQQLQQKLSALTSDPVYAARPEVAAEINTITERLSQLTDPNSMLNDLLARKQTLNANARTAFETWLQKMPSAWSPKVAANDNAGAFLQAYLTLPDSTHLPLDRGVVGQQIGRRTAGGANNEQVSRKVAAYGAGGAVLGGSIYAGSNLPPGTGDTTPTPGLGADELNAGAFALRGMMMEARRQYTDKLRLDAELIAEEGVVTRDALNRYVGRIVASAGNLGTTPQQLFRISALTEQFWANYTYLRNKPLDPASGWTQVQKFHAIMSKVGEWQISVDRELGFQSASISALDARLPTGTLYRGVALATYGVNVVAGVAMTPEIIHAVSTIDWTSPASISTGLSEAAFRSLFLVGNAALAGREAFSLAGGRAGITTTEVNRMQKFLQRNGTGILALGGAAWTVNDGAKAIDALIAQNYPEAVVHAAKAALDWYFTVGARRAWWNEYGKAHNRPANGPHVQNVPQTVMAGALVLRMLLGGLPPEGGDWEL